MKKKELHPLVYKVGKLIKQHREEQNMTQTDLSKLSGVEKSSISRIESGEYLEFQLKTIVKLFVALKIPFATLDDL
ncbi:helix-turn-helix domain-containing protein [Leeuwenhoekiella aequorea]|uniref:Helix-turn-helix protein n=1 Tax=Leeuwenhoekiella aequorea TaxID=283736 RepID=A0A4Q0P5X1_9FLAO|nr:helix-turn-helix transcriptional regulator [Leeuwenhoekiella aequorea]RXG21039.1 helix-turn-helix protein [Leeuwenhoekiella aequorea]|tara:strand:- start:11774 stop:12001 length:228 start_codon:yes stop_codon:yes gene_type:complete